jgi:hypothetical protein
MALKITSVLASGKRIQARRKDSVKVVVKFIRKGICFQQTESRLSPESEHGVEGSVPHAENGSKNSKWWSPTPSLILDSRRNMWSKVMGLGDRDGCENREESFWPLG